MAAVDEIAIKLGIKTGDLKAALADAGADIKAFKKAGEEAGGGVEASFKSLHHGVRELKQILEAAGITELVKSFFELAITSAEKSTDATDKNAAAVREFGHALEGVKSVAGSVAVTVIGTLNRVGEAWGGLAQAAKAFVTNGTAGFEEWQKNERMVIETAGAAEEAELRLAEVRKKSGAEFEQITKQMADIQSRSNELQLKGVDVYVTQENIQRHLNELLDKAALGEGTMLEKRRLALEIAKTKLSLDEATLAVNKATAEEVTKAVEDAKREDERKLKEANDTAKRRALATAEEVELFELQRKHESQLSEAESLRLKTLLLMKKAKTEEDEITQLIEKRVTGTLTPAEADRLDKLIKQKEEVDKQIKALEELKKKLQEIGALPPTVAPPVAATEQAVTKLNADWDAFSAKLGNKGDVRNLSGTQLQTLANQLQDQFAKQTAQRFTNPSYQEQYDPQAESLRLNLEQIRKELALRTGFAQVVSSFGQSAAEAQYSPDDFQRLLQFINPNAQTQTAAAIGRIDQTLQNVFPAAAAGLRPPG